MAIDITVAAAEKVREETAWFLKKQKAENPDFDKEVYLRMGIKGGGCSGFSYVLEWDTEVKEHDKVFPDESMKAAGKGLDWGFRAVIDAKSYLYLNGVTLDYATQGLQGGFTFINPNAKSGCGCGQSFH